MDGSVTYRPTSLDYINLPNPIQPAPQSQRHPLNDTSRLENTCFDTASQIRFILEPSVERACKKQKTTGHLRLDLPKLPVRSGNKRLRIPPTLSGLHHPPPDAGLLPSISTEQPHVPPPRLNVASRPVDRSKNGVTTPQSKQPSPPIASKGAKPASQSDKSGTRRSKRNKWTESETECLLKGVARFGIGSWTKILKCSDYEFNHRTALDLKDRFRVCCPDDYNTPKGVASEKSIVENSSAERSSVLKQSKGPAPDRVSTTTLKTKLGIDQPFLKTARRSRHGYTEAEDAALLRGFKQYGNSWASIRQDPVLGLSARQSTDLRDRMRNRYPEEYAKAGLVLPAAKPSSAEMSEEGATQEMSEIMADATARKQKENLSKDSLENLSEPKRLLQPSLFTLDDLFLGRPFGEDDDDEGDNEPIVLDRGILDWAQGDSNRNMQTDNTKSHGINPMMTLKLPKPLPPIQAPPSSLTYGNMTTALPSVASLLPENTNIGDFELPSLMHGFGPLEGEPKPGNTFPTLEELLSQPLD